MLLVWRVFYFNLSHTNIIQHLICTLFYSEDNDSLANYANFTSSFTFSPNCNPPLSGWGPPDNYLSDLWTSGWWHRGQIPWSKLKMSENTVPSHGDWVRHGGQKVWSAHRKKGGEKTEITRVKDRFVGGGCERRNSCSLVSLWGHNQLFSPGGQYVNVSQ